MTAKNTTLLSEDEKLLISMAIESAEKLVKVYYEKFDKNRHLLSKLYGDSAVLIWEGTEVKSKDGISKFYGSLPGSNHSIESIDSQPLFDFGEDSNAILVSVNGFVRYDKQSAKRFSQNFIVNSNTNKPESKIVSDIYRLFS